MANLWSCLLRSGIKGSQKKQLQIEWVCNLRVWKPLLHIVSIKKKVYIYFPNCKKCVFNEKNANRNPKKKQQTMPWICFNIPESSRVPFFLFAPFFPDPTNQWMAAWNRVLSTGGFLGESQEVQGSITVISDGPIPSWGRTNSHVFLSTFESMMMFLLPQVGYFWPSFGGMLFFGGVE